MRFRPFSYRAVADILIAIITIGGFVLASHSSAAGPLVVAGAALVFFAALTGYCEPLAKRVWIHPVLIMSPELIALPVALLTCRSFECGGIIAFLMLASLSTGVLIGISYLGFAFRRSQTPRSLEQNLDS